MRKPERMKRRQWALAIDASRQYTSKKNVKLLIDQLFSFDINHVSH